MSAAEPAPTPPPGPREHSVGAQVIRFAPRDGRGRRSGTKATTMTSGPDHDVPDDSLRRLAEHLELTYNAADLTLTDQRTAAAFGIAMDIAVTVTAGALAQGLIGDEQQEALAALLAGTKEAVPLV